MTPTFVIQLMPPGEEVVLAVLMELSLEAFGYAMHGFYLRPWQRD
jgi:hypothetical protein